MDVDGCKVVGLRLRMWSRRFSHCADVDIAYTYCADSEEKLDT